MNKNNITPAEAIGDGDQHEIAKCFQNVLPEINNVPEECSIGNTGNKPLVQTVVQKGNTSPNDMLDDETILYYCLPATAACVAGAAFLRYRQRHATATMVEKFLLGGITYYGATSLGATLGFNYRLNTYDRSQGNTGKPPKEMSMDKTNQR